MDYFLLVQDETLQIRYRYLCGSLQKTNCPKCLMKLDVEKLKSKENLIPINK